MDGHSFLADRDVSATKVHPRSGVVVLHSVALQLQRHVGVPAEKALSLALFCVAERACRYLRGKAQPSGVETVKIARKPLASGIKLLQIQENQLADAADSVIIAGKVIKLMAVDGHLP